jgi:hypothetical protein
VTRACLLAIVLTACGGSTAQPAGGTQAATGSSSGSAGSSSGSAGSSSGSAAPVASCDSVRAKVEGLYRAEAQTREPTRVEEATADNTAMVMTDCAKSPEPTIACIGKITTVGELEKQCLTPLDAEGTEGEAAR